MVRIVSTRCIPAENRSRDLYAPTPADDYDNLTFEERLARNAEYRRNLRKRHRENRERQIQAGSQLSPGIQKFLKYRS